MKRFFAVATASVLILGTAHVSAFANGKDHLWSPPSSPPGAGTQVEGWGENRGQTLPFSFSPFDEGDPDYANSEFVREIASYSFDTVLSNCDPPELVIGCIESIKFSIDGETWNNADPIGTLEQRDFAYGVNTEDGWAMQYTSTWEADPTRGLLQASLPNEYELEGAIHGMGENYTINVTAISAIEDGNIDSGIAKIQGLKFEAIAGGVNAPTDEGCEFWGISNSIVDPPVSYCYEAVDLPENLQLEVNVQLGDRINELSGWFDGRIYDPTIIFGTQETGLITVRGSPMKVNYFETLPIPLDHELFDAELGDGGRGVWRPRTGLDTFLRLESFVPPASAEVDSVWKMESWSRDVMIDECSSNTGVQGIIITNATTYSPDPPTFNAESANLEFQVASTHFLPDGETLNSGYYKLIIQESLADCLWGAGNAQSATIAVTNDDGGENDSVNGIQLIDGWVSFTASDFHFSAPKIYVGLNRIIEGRGPSTTPEKTTTPEKSTRGTRSKSSETSSVFSTSTPSPTGIPSQPPSPSPEQSAIAIPQEESSGRIPANLLFGFALATVFAIGAVSMFVRNRF